MKSKLFLVETLRLKLLPAFLILFCLIQSGFGNTVNQFQNPLDVAIADPQVLKDGADYYLYGTTDDGGFSVFQSQDLVNWRRKGHCYTKTATTWGQDNFWAPEVIKVGSKYYLFYTALNPTLNRRNICVAESMSPLGPFIDVTTPILPTGHSFIDGHPYQDPISGEVYLFALREDVQPPKMMVTKLTNPPTATVGSLSEIFTISQSWEGSWVEAPFITRHNNLYYMMYSARWYWESDYSVGYATATNLTGPWTKSPTNPILKKTSTISGPGHNSIIRSPDNTELFVVYHTHLTFAGGGARQLAIDRLQFVTDGTGPAKLQLTAGNPTDTLQVLPSGAVAKNYGISDEFNASLDFQYWNSFGEDTTKYNVANGKLNISAQNGDSHQASTTAKNIFIQYAPDGFLEIESQFKFKPQKNYEQAFLVIWQDESNYIRFSRAWVGKRVFEVGQEINGVYSSTIVSDSIGDTIVMKIVKQNNTFTCYAKSESGTYWSQIANSFSLSAPQLQVGLGAISPVSGEARLAEFEYFRIKPENSAVSDWAIY